MTTERAERGHVDASRRADDQRTTGEIGMRGSRNAALVAVLMATLAGCGSGGGSASSGSTSGASPVGTPAVANRPSSPAVIDIVNPKDGGTVTGNGVDVVVAIQNAHIVQATTSNIRPDEGHVHLYIDGNLQYMAYTLSQTFPLKPGTYTMYAEFVASDHFPFNPRIYSRHIVFTVR
jgi:hypothetical protein